MCVVLNIDEVTFSFLDFSSAVEEVWPAAESEIDARGALLQNIKIEEYYRLL